MKTTYFYCVLSAVVMIIGAIKGELIVMALGLMLYIVAQNNDLGDMIEDLYRVIGGVMNVRYKLQAKDARSPYAEWHDIAASNNKQALEAAAQSMRVKSECKEAFRVIDMEVESDGNKNNLH